MKTHQRLVSIFGVFYSLMFVLMVSPAFAQLPDESIITIKGQVIDKITKKPLSYTNIYIANTPIGIVANNEGTFILKVPKPYLSNKITFSYLGYNTININLKELNNEDNTVMLDPQIIAIKEVLISPIDPLMIIKNAVNKISDNYGRKPYICTAFYRESIKQNKRYISVAEGVFNVYKASYNKESDLDKIKLYKGIKTEDKQYIDTMVMKLRGGYQTDIQLDVVKNLPAFLDFRYFQSYNYKPVTSINIDGNETYIIEFEVNKDVPEALYNGKIYIDINSLAIKKLEFSINPIALKTADKLLILKKPKDMNIKTVNGIYSVDYRNLNGRWTLNHVHNEVKFKVDKKGHLFSRLYTISSDFVITDKDTINVSKIKQNETIKPDVVFIDQVSNFYDKDFWGSYNVIKPEEAIELVVERISKKMRKNK